MIQQHSNMSFSIVENKKVAVKEINTIFVLLQSQYLNR